MHIMEILAVLFAVLTIVKVVVTLRSPSARVEMVEKAAKHKTSMSLLYLALTLLSGYVVIGYLGVVNVAAVMMFTYFMMGFAIMPFIDPFIKATKPYLKDPSALLMKSWPSVILWLVLAVWVLVKVFG